MTDAFDEEDEKPRPLPDKFRASLDESDAAAFARLQANDERQKEWLKKSNSAFIDHAPKERERANALILIETLENVREHQKLTDEQVEQLAESYAAIGEYRTAKQITISPEKEEVYEKYRQAVWLDDGEWCDHDESAKYIKENVFSVKESREMPLLACNVCGTWNVADAPQNLLDAQKTRAAVRAAVKGMDNKAAKRYLESNFKK